MNYETLYHYRVSIYKKDDVRSKWDIERKDEFINEVVNVVAQNDRYLIIGDWYLTRINKDKSDYDTYINKVSIWARTKDTLLGNGVFYNVYCTEPKTTNSIKKEIEKFIKKEFGWLSVGIDLSIIK